MVSPVVWANVDLNAIAQNVRALRNRTNPEARMMAVVKADAYGHGVEEVTRTALANGAETLGVARLHEGIELRNMGFDAPILIFGYTPPVNADALVQYDLIQTLISCDYGKDLSNALSAGRKSIRSHLKIDTGLGRVGILPDHQRPAVDADDNALTAVEEAVAAANLPGIEVEGIFTHFATADSADKAYARTQLDVFLNFMEALRTAGIAPITRHAANSAAIIDMPETHLDMVRAGVSLYGLYPSDEIDKTRIDLQPAMSLHTRIAHLKAVPAGFKVSYSITYETTAPTTIATVPIGYADGLSRLLSPGGDMLVRGQRAPIVGRICMDQLMLDVGHIPDADIDDEVVVFGRQEAAFIPVEEVAAKANTINYEIACAVSKRVPRIYVNG